MKQIEKSFFLKCYNSNQTWYKSYFKHFQDIIGYWFFQDFNLIFILSLSLSRKDPNMSFLYFTVFPQHPFLLHLPPRLSFSFRSNSGAPSFSLSACELWFRCQVTSHRSPSSAREECSECDHCAGFCLMYMPKWVIYHH